MHGPTATLALTVPQVVNEDFRSADRFIPCTPGWSTCLQSTAAPAAARGRRGDILAVRETHICPSPPQCLWLSAAPSWNTFSHLACLGRGTGTSGGNMAAERGGVTVGWNGRRYVAVVIGIRGFVDEGYTEPRESLFRASWRGVWPQLAVRQQASFAHAPQLHGLGCMVRGGGGGGWRPAGGFRCCRCSGGRGAITRRVRHGSVWLVGSMQHRTGCQSSAAFPP